MEHRCCAQEDVPRLHILGVQCAGFLNRASWLRQDGDYLTKACKSDEAKFVILDGTSNPLVRKEDRSKGVKDVVKEKLEGRPEYLLVLIDVNHHLTSVRVCPLSIGEREHP